MIYAAVSNPKRGPLEPRKQIFTLAVAMSEPG
jgi:hypothetical protein